MDSGHRRFHRDSLVWMLPLTSLHTLVSTVPCHHQSCFRMRPAEGRLSTLTNQRAPCWEKAPLYTQSFYLVTISEKFNLFSLYLYTISRQDFLRTHLTPALILLCNIFLVFTPVSYLKAVFFFKCSNCESWATDLKWLPEMASTLIRLPHSHCS